MSAEEGDRWGFHNRLVAPEELMDAAMEMARLAAGPSFAHGITKTQLNNEWAVSLDAAIEMEAQAQAICMQTRDFRRAYRAFAAKLPTGVRGDVTTCWDRAHISTLSAATTFRRAEQCAGFPAGGLRLSRAPQCRRRAHRPHGRRRASATSTALIGNGRRRTCKELTDWSNRIAHVLVENYGVKPGNRGPNPFRQRSPQWWPVGWPQRRWAPSWPTRCRCCVLAN